MSVTPYLQVTDAKKAIDFYVEAFGAVEQFRLPAEDGKKIMHAVLAIAGGAEGVKQDTRKESSWRI